MIVILVDRQAAIAVIAILLCFLVVFVWLCCSINRKFSRICELIESEETALEQRETTPPSKHRLFLVDGDEVY